MNKHSRVAIAGLFALGLMTGAQMAHAAAGILDPAFGSGGKVVTKFANRNAPFLSPIAEDIALQPDGKIVVAMGLDNSSIATEAFGVARYLPGGVLDRSFGNGGSVQTAFTNFINSPSSIALQADGKIVEAGTASSADGTTSEFAVARFNPNGSLDPSFGSGGKVTTNFVGVMLGGVSNPANALLIQPNGKILVGGGASECGKCVTNTALARYNSNGSLDKDFGANGMVDVKAVGSLIALAEDTAGNIFTGGSVAAEFAPNGALDSTITPAPVVVSSHGGPIAFQPDGFDLEGEGAAGVSRHDTEAQVVRFSQAGAVDPSFVNPPFDYTAESPTGQDSIAEVTLQPDGEVIAAGGPFGVARLLTDGSLDPGFGMGGLVTTSNFPGQTAGATINGVIVQPDGNIVVAGTGFNNTTGITSLVLVRYLGN